MIEDRESLLTVAEADSRHTIRINQIMIKGTKTSGNDEQLNELVNFMIETDGEERKKLDGRQKFIFEEWIENGVRFDTSHWLKTLAAYFQDRSLFTPEAIIAALFIDTYNRADDVFDTFRQLFADSAGGIVTESLRSVPILRLSDKTAASVGDFMDILLRLILTTGTYTGREILALQKDIQTFLKVSREAIERVEKAEKGVAISYSELDALDLRELTLQPLVTVACRMYASIKYRGGPLDSFTKGLEQDLRAKAIVVQILDDCKDYKEDFQNGNTNLILGILADACRARGMKADESMLQRIKNVRNGDMNDTVAKEIIDMVQARTEQLYKHYLLQISSPLHTPSVSRLEVF